MINNDEKKQEMAKASGVYTGRPDSNAICESLVSKLREKTEEEKAKAKIKPRRKDKNETDPMTDSDDSDQEEEETRWSKAPPLSKPIRIPRAFEKSDYLYEKQMEKADGQETEDWSGQQDEYPHEDSVTLKDAETSSKP